MITAWDIYWLTRTDGILLVAKILTVSFIVIIPMSFSLILLLELWNTKDWIKVKIFEYVSIIVLVLSVLVYVFVPSSKELAVIYLLPKIVNNEQAQKIPENFVKLLNVKMNEWISGMEEKKK